MTSTSVLRFSTVRILLSGILAAATVSVSSAGAQDFDRIAAGLTDTLQTAIDMLPEDVTNVRLGLGPVMAPDYEGSNSYNIDPVPVVSLRYKNFLEVDNNEVKITAFNRLFNTNTNMGGGRSLRAGPLVSINFGRSQKASPDLAGMGSVGTAFELGGFVSYTFSPDSRVRLRARQDVASGHNGATVMADYAHTFIRTAKYALGGSVSGTWATGPYMRSFFGVTPAQAAASGYPVFTPGSGFKDMTFGLNGNYRIAARWALVANASYKRLVGAAADSPIVRIAGTPNQMSFSTFVVYSF